MFVRSILKLSLFKKKYRCNKIERPRFRDRSVRQLQKEKICFSRPKGIDRIGRWKNHKLSVSIHLRWTYDELDNSLRTDFMNRTSRIGGTALLVSITALLPSLALGQAGIASEREAIVSYSAEELNPTQPGY